MDEQIPYAGTLASIQIASNPEPRCACALVLDVSGSMSGDAIAELNHGVQCLVNELSADSLASKRVEISIVTFGESVELVSDFSPPRQMMVPKLEAGGGTPMGEAVVKAENRSTHARGSSISGPGCSSSPTGNPRTRDPTSGAMRSGSCTTVSQTGGSCFSEWRWVVPGRRRWTSFVHPKGHPNGSRD